MLILENIRLAVTGLLSNKMRAFLTMLGIIIGIGSVITIMTVGDSVTQSVTSSMQSLGANNINVILQQKSSDDELSGNGFYYEDSSSYKTPEDSDYITDEMIEAFAEKYGEHLIDIAFQESVGSGQANNNKLYANVYIYGVNGGFFTANELTMLAGRQFSANDYDDGRKVALVSDKFVNNMFAGDVEAAIGETIEVTIDKNFYQYTIVGVYEYEQTMYNMSFGPEKDMTTNLFIPVKTAQDQMHKNSGYQSFTIVTKGTIDSDTFCSQVERFFNAYYRNNQYFEIMAFSLESMVAQFSSVLGTIELAITVIAAISLLVGGIGVMNIMLVSITERTREIGTRKALGATNASIRMQFIIEAVIICLIGGAIGVILGVVLGSVATNALGYPAVAAVKSIVISLLFSMTIGIFFGYYPANKAAKMDPIEALRYE